jgi:Gram-negative porin
MIGGSMKTTSRFALAAAAGLLLGAAVTPVKAADLGGGCCADLEERVAELEATTARKGNRVVSLQVYGQVNKALLIFDDGRDSDAYVVDNDDSGSRVGFIGKATFKPGWTAGYNIELDIQDSASDKVSQKDDPVFVDGGNGGDEGNANEISIRMNNVYIESDRFGRFTIGQQSSAADGINEIVLGNSVTLGPGVFAGNNFLIRGTNNLRLSNFANDLDGNRLDLIRYDSPSIYGFIVSASWGENDYADVALRFKKEWNSIRIAAGIAYQMGSEATDSSVKDQNVLSGSISMMHVPTGIYGAFAAGEATDRKNTSGADLQDENFWYAQLGIEKKFLPYGTTTVYGEYGNYDDFATKNLRDSSNAEKWGFGVVQKIDSAAMDIYAQYSHWSFDDNVTGGDNPEDFSTIMIGSRIKF